MKLGVVGAGVVGRATARAFLEHVDEVRVCDRLRERTTHDPKMVLDCDLVFVCLPEDELDGWFGRVHPQFRDVSFVIKSTCPIGTTRRLAEHHALVNLCHSPEFLTERCAMTDVQVPARNIIGMPNSHTRHQEVIIAPSGEQTIINYPTQTCYRALRRLYEQRFPGVPVLAMSSDESEAVKLFQNGFFACKVAYFNEVRALADKLGLDWETVRAGMLSDGRIAHSHTAVPGWDGKRGFGGRCLQKDSEMLARQIAEIRQEPAMLRAALHRNEDIDRKSDA